MGTNADLQGELFEKSETAGKIQRKINQDVFTPVRIDDFVECSKHGESAKELTTIGIGKQDRIHDGAMLRESEFKTWLEQGGASSVAGRDSRAHAIRTLERWEQGRSSPPESAAALIFMAQKYPDTFDRLASL